MTAQVITAAVLNLRMLPKRWGSALIACIAIACVVLVLVAILAVSESFERLMVAGTFPSTVLILRHDARLENGSTLDRSSVELITGYAKTQVSESPVSPELMRTVRAKRPRNGDFVDIEMRGVTPDAIAFRRGFKIVQGRMFQDGRGEIIVGKAAQDQFSGLTLGSTIRLVDTDWRIVGVFEASGSASESEVWTGLGDLQTMTHQEGVVDSIRMRVATESARVAMQRYFGENPITDDFVQSESQYYDRTVSQLTNVMRKFGIPVLLIMVWGAVFVSLNTMYGSVTARGKDLSTLRAIGFRTAPLVQSLVIESIVLAVIGGLIGVAVAALALSLHYA
jgi:putative ABC transport system permease protein